MKRKGLLPINAIKKQQRTRKKRKAKKRIDHLLLKAIKRTKGTRKKRKAKKE